MCFRKNKFFCTWPINLLLLLAVWCSCEDKHRQTNIHLTKGLFTVSAAVSDSIAVRDVLNELSNGSQSICSRLDHHFNSPVLVTLYPTQATLDRDGMNPAMYGFRAYSGSNRIEMVTPSQSDSLPGYLVPYHLRIRVALHEFTHLVLNDINSNLPLWVNEGVACFVGPHELYDYVCHHKFPFEMVPSISALQNSYHSVKAADLFSYAVVDFIRAESGESGLRTLVREPEKAFALVNVTGAQNFDLKWHVFLTSNYRKE